MKEIKIIDLLNMIAEMEKVPDKVKFDDVIYKYDEIRRDYYDKINDKYLINMLINRYKMYYALNQTVEIIEEDNNKIEKLKYHNSIPDEEDIKDNKQFIKEILKNENCLLDKINEIIDKINNMEE